MLAQFRELVAIDVAHNDLDGIINDADFEHLSNLRVLILSGNRFTLNMTKNWVPPFQLEELCLGHCQLGPQFPNWIQTQKNLSHIDLSYNNISDTVPNWFWDLSANVKYMNLSYNDFRGHVPDFSSNCTLMYLI